MKFIDFLYKNYELIKNSSLQTVSSISSHSEKVKKKSLFIALKGKQSDGHDYLKQAIKQGARVLLVNHIEKVPKSFKGLLFRYQNPHKNLPQLLNSFYDFPSQKLFLVAVTGTNGKTSFCYLLEKIYNDCGWPTAVIGTVDQHFLNHKWPSRLTTPDSVEIFEKLTEFVNLGARATVMEVSSHALDQKRVEGIEFKALVFTNLSQDHLDDHGTMDNYFQIKKQLFQQAIEGKNKNFFCLFNRDDPYGKRLYKEFKSSSFTYGQSLKSDFHFQIKKREPNYSQVFIQSPSGSLNLKLPLAGKFNIYNAVSALACALLTGFKGENCIQALESFSGIPGRLEKLEASNLPFDIFLDYAHTPEALSAVLQTLKPYGKKLILLFGCGGDRDKTKRPLMMDKALQFADHIFLTTDNPRFERPEHIIQDTLQNTSKHDRKRITSCLNRKEAIQKALQFAKKGDQILISGKGHESFQIVKNQKIPFSDKQTVLDSLKEMGFKSRLS